MTETPTMPAFVFVRHADIERETGLILAGKLIVDIPKSTKPKGKHQRMIAKIVQQLIDHARSGQMPDNTFIYGWAGGSRPANAVDVHDDAVMAAWAKDRIVIALRVDPRNGDYFRVDSDMLLEMGPITVFNARCPHCGKVEGPIWISNSFWFYCRDHKVKWLAGWDLSVADTPTPEQQRRHDEIGLGEFKYIGPDVEGYERKR
jgi:hypothetical protein